MPGRRPAADCSGFAGQFMSEYVRSGSRPLRSADAIESAFNRLVKPPNRKRCIYGLKEVG